MFVVLGYHKCLSLVAPVSSNYVTNAMWWELEKPFDGQLCQECLCQKSSKSVNPS